MQEEASKRLFCYKLCPGWGSVQAAVEAPDGIRHMRESQGRFPRGLENELPPERGIDMGHVRKGRRSSPGGRACVRAWTVAG